jgi:signal transduction histidine kinase
LLAAEPKQGPEDASARVEELDLRRRLRNVRALTLAFTVISALLLGALLAVGMDPSVIAVTAGAIPLFAVGAVLARSERWGRVVAVLLNAFLLTALFAAVAANRQLGPGPAFVGFSLFVAAATLPLRGVVVSGVVGALVVVAEGYVSRDEPQLVQSPATATTYGLALCLVTTVLSVIQARNSRRALVQVVDRERQAIALASQLQQSQKMDALGRMAAAVAHDFNNLLTVIRAAVTLASSDVPAESVSNEALRAADKASMDAASLTKRLLAFARKPLQELEVIDSRGVLAALAELLPRAIGPDVRLDLRLDDELPPIVAAPAQVEQVLLNLAINARDAMPRGGTLTLAARSRAAPSNGGATGAAPSGEWLELKVSDTGFGMDDSVMAHLFEPFFTTKPVGMGTGLGLSTCYGIVTQLGGTIRADSVVGQGTTFTILLPRADPAKS